MSKTVIHVVSLVMLTTGTITSQSSQNATKSTKNLIQNKNLVLQNERVYRYRQLVSESQKSVTKIPETDRLGGSSLQPD